MTKHTQGLAELLPVTIGKVGIECIRSCIAFCEGHHHAADIAARQLQALAEQHKATTSTLAGINPEAVPELIAAANVAADLFAKLAEESDGDWEPSCYEAVNALRAALAKARETH